MLVNAPGTTRFWRAGLTLEQEFHDFIFICLKHHQFSLEILWFDSKLSLRQLDCMHQFGQVQKTSVRCLDNGKRSPVDQLA